MVSIFISFYFKKELDGNIFAYGGTDIIIVGNLINIFKKSFVNRFKVYLLKKYVI